MSSRTPATRRRQVRSVALRSMSTAVSAFLGWTLVLPADSFADDLPPPDRVTDTRPPTTAAHAALHQESDLDTPVPTDWMPSKGKQCHRYRRRHVCEGPLRVPVPFGEDRARALRLGLGTSEVASHLLLHAPFPEWVEAAVDPNRSNPTQAVAAEGADQLPFAWPVDEGRLWRGFGGKKKVRGKKGRRRKRGHQGMDIGAEPGTRVRAVDDGIVAYSHNGVRGYGNLVMVVHPDASVTFYGHLRAAYVFAGQRVRRGQTLGEVGATGITRGPHLHFEWRVDGRPRDPQRRFDRERGRSPLASVPFTARM